MAFNRCFTDTVYDVNGLREYADKCLFSQTQSDFHCLHHILPPIKPDGAYLRARGHDYILPKCDSSLYIEHHLCRDVCTIICKLICKLFN
jgi:hypothetical protein